MRAACELFRVHTEKSVQIKAGTCKNTHSQPQTSPFHTANDANADEDPVEDSDDTMETLNYSCLLLVGGTDGWTLTSWSTQSQYSVKGMSTNSLKGCRWPPWGQMGITSNSAQIKGVIPNICLNQLHSHKGAESQPNFFFSTITADLLQEFTICYFIPSYLNVSEQDYLCGLMDTSCLHSYVVWHVFKITIQRSHTSSNLAQDTPHQNDCIVIKAAAIKCSCAY